MLEIYVDGDACPVKPEVFKVAQRHDLVVHIVSNRGLRPNADPRVRQVVVGEGLDAADDWIAEHIGPGDIAVTADIGLAARCLKAGARPLGPTGKPFTEANIGMAQSLRDLTSQLRDSGEIRGGGPGFSKRDRSRFLEQLEITVQAVRRGR
ncbi:MAG: YaiI/YqxD family protein [Pseudomonadota bacterium]